MKQTAVIRVTGEICFFFSILNVFEYYRTLWLPMALFTAACFGVGFLIVRCKKALTRFCLSLLPGLCFLLAPLEPLVLFPVLAWVYYILVMTQGNYALPLDEYRKTYTGLMVICLLFVVANIANSFIYRNHLISAESLIYVFLFLFLGVVAMRRMQMGAEMNRTWELANAISVAGFPVLVVAGVVLLFLLLRFSAPAVALLLTPIGKFMIWLFNKLFPSQGVVPETPKEVLKPEVNILPYEPDMDVGGASDPLDADTWATSTLLIEKAASIGAYVVLGILMLLAVYLVLKHVRRNQPLKEGAELYYDETEEDLPEKKRRRGKNQPVLGNARQLRRIYQTYLEFVNQRGLSIRKTDTSAEILERAKKIQDSPQAERLRELYIAARYGDPKAITRQQVEEAQACLEEIVETKKA